jgi:membrane protein YdbS with pleckstrin-like domain
MLPIMKHTGRLWLSIAAAAVLIAGHGVILYYVSSHMAVSAAAIAGVILLVFVKHLGLLGPLYAMLRKRRKRP